MFDHAEFEARAEGLGIPTYTLARKDLAKIIERIGFTMECAPLLERTPAIPGVVTKQQAE